jgi:hypothetical protein
MIMKIKTHTLVSSTFIFLLCLLLNTANANDSTELAPESKALLEEFTKAVKPMLVSLTINAQTNGSDIGLSQSIQLPKQTRSNAGLVLDSVMYEFGLKVLAVSIDSAAEKAGIEANDIIHFINGKTVVKMAPMHIKKQLDLNGVTNVGLFSPEKVIDVQMVTEQFVVPSIDIQVYDESSNSPSTNIETGIDTRIEEQSCGILSTEYQPLEHKRLFQARASKINGKNVNRRYKNIRLAPGKYTIDVRSFVPKSAFGNIPTRPTRANTLTILIKPNVRYNIAARLLDNRYARGNEHWEAVVWEAKETACKGVSNENFKPI